MSFSVPASLRALVKRPGFTLAAVGIVALGVALATTAASIVDALVFRQIPTHAVSELYRVHSGVYSGQLSPPDARDLFERIEAPSFGYHHRFSVEYMHGSHAGLLVQCELQGDPFRVLQWRADQGRLLQPSDFLAGSEPVAVVSHAFWKNDLGSSPSTVGESILLNGKNYRIVGILPPENNRVHRTIKPQVWTTLVNSFETWLYDNRNAHWQFAIFRLEDPGKLPGFQTQLDQVTAYLKETHPAESKNVDLQAIPESQAARQSSEEATQQSFVISALVAMLLLIACFNVGNMLLANAYRREREFAIRRSVGATPLQIARCLLSESFSIAILGGVLGMALSILLVRLADGLPFARWVDVQLNSNAIAIGLVATLITGFVSGLAPTWNLARGNTSDSLKRGSKDSNVTFAAKFLVVAQISLSTSLLTATFLYVSSLRQSFAFDPGYSAGNLSYFSLSVQSMPQEKRYQATEQLLEQIKAIPGVTHAGYSTNRPLGGYGSSHLKTDRFDPGVEADDCFSYFSFVSTGYIDSLGATLLQGRDFLPEEKGWPLNFAIVNQAFEKRFFPDEEIIGQEFWPWGGAGEERVRIVGMVADFSAEPWETPKPLMLLPLVQPRMTMLVRSQADPASVHDSLSALIHQPDSEYVAEEIHTFRNAQERAFTHERSALYVLSLLAVCALFLSSAGVWYTTRQYVSQSRKELSIRLAIGASPRSLLVLILRRSLLLTAAGLACGLVLSFVATRLIQSSLNGLDSIQVQPYVATCLILLLVAFLASYLPARSASRADPRESLAEV